MLRAFCSNDGAYSTINPTSAQWEVVTFFRLVKYQLQHHWKSSNIPDET